VTRPPTIPPRDLCERVQALLGSPPVRFTRIERGYTPAERWRLELADGQRVFAKQAVDAWTAAALRREQRVYDCVRGDFMVRRLGWHEDEVHPLLLLEDLGDAETVPPWSDERIDAVFDALGRMHETSVRLPPFDHVHADIGWGWSEVARNPAAFLSLELVSGIWLERSLHRLVAAERELELGGLDFGHFDLRSDNLLFVEGRAVLVDWSAACLGPPVLDVGFWLPSLHGEGGPAPDAILPGAPDVSAFVSGFFASRAGLPELPHAPRVRTVQREQLRAALPWAVRELGLPPADGPNAGELLAP